MRKPTGLKDRFGKEIFVGDRLKVLLVISGSYVVGTVVEDKDNFAIEMTDGLRYLLQDCSKFGEVQDA